MTLPSHSSDGNGSFEPLSHNSTIPPIDVARQHILAWRAVYEAIPTANEASLGADGDYDPPINELLDREANLMMLAVQAIRRANGEARPGVASSVVMADGRQFVAMPVGVEMQYVAEIHDSPHLPWAIIETAIARS